MDHRLAAEWKRRPHIVVADDCLTQSRKVAAVSEGVPCLGHSTAVVVVAAVVVVEDVVAGPEIGVADIPFVVFAGTGIVVVAFVAWQATRNLPLVWEGTAYDLPPLQLLLTPLLDSYFHSFV